MPLPPQDDSSGEAASPLVLGPQPSTLHPLFAVDVPVYVLQVWMPYNSGFVSKTVMMLLGF